MNGNSTAYGKLSAQIRSVVAFLMLLVGLVAGTLVVPQSANADGGYDYYTYTPTYESGYDYYSYTPSYDSGYDYYTYTPTYDYDSGGYDYYTYTPTYDYYDYDSYYEYDGYYDYDGWYDYSDYSYDYSYDYGYDYGYDYVYNDYSYDYGYDYDYDYHYDRPSYDSPDCTIEASDRNVEEGDYVTLTWETEDADDVSLTGFGSVSRNGSERVRMTNDKTFTLRVEGRGGSETCSVDVRVEEERERDTDLWCELDVSDSSVEEGDTVTLEWDTRGDVREASINQGVGSVDEDGGTERVRVNRDTTFRLTIEDRDGDEEDCSVTVRVDDDSLAPPPDVPLVYLSQLPYTGAEDSMMYWILVITGSGLVGYALFFRALPFAYARVKMLRSDTETSEEVVGEGEAAAPQNVTRQDVRAFVSAIAAGDTASAKEFARAGGAVLFAEAAVVLDDVVRSRENGTPADPMVGEVTKGWDASKFEALIEAFANGTDESVVEKAIA